MTLNTFLKTHRVLKRGEYKAIMRYGLRYSTAHFILFINKNNKDHHRLGIVASRKTGNAVTRNRAKRVIREYFRKFYKQMIKNEPHDLVFLCKKEIENISLKKVYDQMEKLYEKNINIFYTDIPKNVVRAVS